MARRQKVTLLEKDAPDSASNGSAGLSKDPVGPFCMVVPKGDEKHVLPSHRSFCIAMLNSGNVVRCEGDSPAEFMGIIADSKIAWINFTLSDVEGEAPGIAASLGFNPKMVSEILFDYSKKYEDFDTELGLRLPAVTVNKLEVNVSPLVILLRKGVILTMHGGEVIRLVRFSRYAHTFMRKIDYNAPWQDILTSVLVRIIDENNDRNFDHLREIQEEGDELSKSLMDPETPRARLGEDIYKMKHALITHLNSLWYTLDVINSLRYGDAEVITDDKNQLNRITMLANDVTNQISLSEHMSEVLASGLEVLQSIYNNQLQVLNNQLAFAAAWLAVIGTAVLVPNTLATIFGIGPIAEHFSWQSITAILLLSSILSGAFMYWFIRKRGWFPKRAF
ncbi:MAG: CorA family divalent cation transporter [Candidatus Altiarchaeota archaeon]|nr:CorA family divalent cation transporter [Candidatus Altiarchaeota archaeon]